MRTASAAAVEAGAPESTRAMPRLDATSGSPMQRISCSSALELRVSETAPTVKVTVADSSPSMFENVGMSHHQSFVRYVSLRVLDELLRMVHDLTLAPVDTREGVIPEFGQ